VCRDFLYEQPYKVIFSRYQLEHIILYSVLTKTKRITVQFYDDPVHEILSPSFIRSISGLSFVFLSLTELQF